MTVQPPPIYEPVIGQDGKATLPWILFFNQVFTGDAGTSWAPTFTGLTISGTPTLTGTIYRLSSRLVFFSALITPATSTTAIAGTTYIDNFPLTINKDGSVLAASANSASPGMAVAASQRIYTPAWSAFTTPVTISGLLEAS